MSQIFSLTQAEIERRMTVFLGLKEKNLASRGLFSLSTPETSNLEGEKREDNEVLFRHGLRAGTSGELFRPKRRHKCIDKENVWNPGCQGRRRSRAKGSRSKFRGSSRGGGHPDQRRLRVYDHNRSAPGVPDKR